MYRSHIRLFLVVSAVLVLAAVSSCRCTKNRAPGVPVISNVTALPHEDHRASIRDGLVRQATSPVRWSDSMTWAVANLEGQMIELAPGKVLSGLMRRIDRKAKVDNFAEPAACEARVSSSS